jgi:4-hydroxy-tetrahydrodipicolinate reductase
MIDLVLLGAAGRMGRAIEDAVLTHGDFAIRARIDRAENSRGLPGVWSDDLGDHVAKGSVVIDFSAPESARAAAALCAERGAALVSGTTGLGPEDEAVFQNAAKKIAVLRASNFSLGVAILRRALRAALEAMPEGWDVEIVERHHRRKVDSPSGTALVLADDVARARGLDRRAFRNGRQGKVGARPAGEVGLHAVRGGTWVGDHMVLLAGEGESLELRHVAESRAAFAQGALAAARFVSSATPGLYGVEDCLETAGRMM